MDAANRDVILADFQACTDIDDVALAILHLETSNWDLLAAINNVMPHNSQQLPSEMNRDVEMIEEIKPIQASISNPSEDIVEVMPGTSSSSSVRGNVRPTANVQRIKRPPKQLSFNVNYLDSCHKIEIPDSSTLVDLKLQIFNLTKVPSCLQKLHGWRKEPEDDFTTLKSLCLPHHTELYMAPLTEVGETASQEHKLSDRITSTYRLNIKDEVNNTSYDLNFPGATTIQELKSSIYTLNDIPVRHQVWKGWPPHVKSDSLSLAQTGIPLSGNSLTVSKKSPKEKKKEMVNLVTVDSSADEDADDFDDAPESFQVDDDIFIDQVQTPRIQHLIPDNVNSELVGTVAFLDEYKKRYGPNHPAFFTGTLEDAVAESCSKSPRDRKLLAIYLHHDNSILANVFCTQLLGHEAILQLLAANFVIWGWDCTHESNKQKFLASTQQVFGPTVTSTVRSIDVDAMPVLMIIMRTRSSTDIAAMVYGNTGANDLLTNLIEAVDDFQKKRKNDIEFEDERQDRERVKEEQDQAYYESLAADRAKEERKQQQEKMEKEKKEQAENERLAVKARKEAHRALVESCLPAEPSQDEAGVLKIKVRLPSGEFLERRFTKDSMLQTVLNFLIVKGFPTEDFKLISSWPRRDLTNMDSKQTLNELNFSPQETLILEER